MPRHGARLLLAVGFVLIVLNLRPALSSRAPILVDVMRDTGITTGSASLLTHVAGPVHDSGPAHRFAPGWHPHMRGQCAATGAGQA